jgi:multidrug resistance efflux pump
MKYATAVLTCIAILLAAVGAPLPAQQVDQQPGQAAAKPGPAAQEPGGTTVRVEKGPFKIEVTLKGVFEAQETAEVALRLEAWAALVVKKALEHGTPVSQGDTLVWLDLEKIDQAIRELQADGYLSDLAIKQAEEELRLLEKSTPQDLAAAERAKKMADEDLQRFLTVDRPLSEKSAHFSVRNARNYLAYAQEELNQLEKMYKADELTEDTEEIILKRQRDQVESATFSLEMAENRRDQTLKVDMPRREQTVNDNAQKTTLSWERAQATLPITLNQKRLALEKQKYEREKSADRLRKLTKDREAMNVRAPADGVVYHGKALRGNWTTAATVAGKLQPGGALMAEEVFMTIVKPRPIQVRAVIEEKDLEHVRAGLKGKAVAVALPDLKLPARVESVSAVPISAGNFDAKLSVELGPNARAIMPGMACSMKLVPYHKADALTIPASAVFTEDEDEGKHYVYVAGKNGQQEKRDVKPGKKSGTKVEILEGLKEGEEVLRTKPE